MQNITWVIQRHGKTTKTAADIDRQLDDVGREQGAAMAEKLLVNGLLPAILTLSSIAPRAVDTVKKEGVTVITLPELYMPEDPAEYAEFNRMAGVHGYSPLRIYKAHDETGVFQRYGERAAAAVLKAAEENGVTSGTVHVGHHAICANALALALIGDRNEAARELVLDLELGECGVIVIFPDGDVEIVTL